MVYLSVMWEATLSGYKFHMSWVKIWFFLVNKLSDVLNLKVEHMTDCLFWISKRFWPLLLKFTFFASKALVYSIRNFHAYKETKLSPPIVIPPRIKSLGMFHRKLWCLQGNQIVTTNCYPPKKCPQVPWAVFLAKISEELSFHRFFDNQNTTASKHSRIIVATVFDM
jgi:hypothetical protein